MELFECRELRLCVPKPVRISEWDSSLEKMFVEFKSSPFTPRTIIFGTHLRHSWKFQRRYGHTDRSIHDSGQFLVIPTLFTLDFCRAISTIGIKSYLNRFANSAFPSNAAVRQFSRRYGSGGQEGYAQGGQGILGLTHPQVNFTTLEMQFNSVRVASKSAPQVCRATLPAMRLNEF